MPDRALRYVRQVTLPGFGRDGQRRLDEGRVLVIGAGGLGSAVLPSLAAAGIGVLGVIDDDRVEVTNLHRQLLHGQADVGRSKVESARETLLALGAAHVETYDARFTADTADALLAGYDLVIDGSDNYETRYLTNDAASRAGIPLVWGAVSQYAGHVGVVLPGDPDYRDLFPAPPDPAGVLTCEIGGVLPTVVAVIGATMATETLKVLTGIGTPLSGRITTYDALTARFREVPFTHDPDRDRTCPAAPPTSEEDTVTETPASAELDVRELQDLVEDGTPVQLIDVREPWEADIAAIDGSRLIPLGTLADVASQIDPSVPVIAYCHHGMRSQQAVEILRAAGVPARSLIGGIDAWSRIADPSVPRY